MYKSFCSSSPDKEQGSRRRLFDGSGPRLVVLFVGTVYIIVILAKDLKAPNIV